MTITARHRRPLALLAAILLASACLLTWSATHDRAQAAAAPRWVGPLRFYTQLSGKTQQSLTMVGTTLLFAHEVATDQNLFMIGVKNYCLDGSNAGVNSTIAVRPCNYGNPNQRWHIDSRVIQNARTGLCIQQPVAGGFDRQVRCNVYNGEQEFHIAGIA